MKFVLMRDGLENWFNKNFNVTKRGITFNRDEMLVAKECLKRNGYNFIYTLFDKVGIHYDTIIPKVLIYTLNDEQFSLSDLSSGERDYLYALFCKYTNTPFVLVGTLERLDIKHRKRFLEDIINYDNGYIVTMSRMIVGKNNLELYEEVS